MKLRDCTGWMAVVIAAAAAGLILGGFVRNERSYAPLTTLPPLSPAQVQEVEGELIDINTATAEELTALPGIGPTRAEAIVAYREEHGPFRFPEEIVYVKGIGEKTMRNVLSRITAGGG